ncbi:catalase [Aequorivita sp. SDUM287046]|uniref:Catalase n=1 Tax=Aequorivita aurantiaca TaxID=3053356 RepID=A0ABT8DQI4_9FLAO|nr:catalase [Aequorivita aurantiaca]MDN3725498.1 catalase [Aequorivita aurantiaca]
MADDTRRKMEEKTTNSSTAKNEQLDQHSENGEGQYLTTSTGVRINHTNDSLKAGSRGPTIMEDFHFREKMTHFDHERIPERVVHARGSAAHGYFQSYGPIPELTKAKLFNDPEKKTPVFVRISTVVGFRGSADTVRDVRGFATKFYTEEGNWDLVGNNMPVFFIQDGIKFPDLVHAIKPEPHNEMPQASAAHDNFWDFVSLMPESMHTIMWVMSDRAFPRSYAMMEGFGVHTFRFVNAEGKSKFVKFHWKPVAGIHSLVWDEAQKIAGKDPDFNRRDLWEAIEMGNYPEFELGVQVVDPEDEFAFDFDLLDPTKIIPEEVVPIKMIGKMTLNRNPDNFFAETEQVAFHPGHVVPGIDFTNDPLLQGRLFSYVDTQLIRLGGPNFNEIPINRPVVEVHNNQRDGFMRQTINKGKTNYFPNSRGGGCPMMAPETAGGYLHHMEKVEGHKIRERSDSFKDYFGQAKLFYNSQTEIEKKHIMEAFHFELGKVKDKEIRQRMVYMIANVDKDLAVKVANGIGINPPTDEAKIKEVAQDHIPREKVKSSVDTSPAVSMENRNNKKGSIKGRKVAIMIDEGFDYETVMQVKKKLMDGNATAEIVSKFHGMITASNGETLETDKNHITTASVLYDAIFIPGGAKSVARMKNHGDVIQFINEAYKHCKPLAFSGEAVELLENTALWNLVKEPQNGVNVSKGVVMASNNDNMGDFSERFMECIAQHRFWEREDMDHDSIPA